MNFFCMDDDVLFLNKLKNVCLKYSIQQNIDINILQTNSIPKEIPKEIDAFFLDVEFPNYNIFDFLDKIRKENIIIPIIIISNYDYYVHDSVKYNIFDFIRKKNFDNEINDTLNRLSVYLESALPIVSFKTISSEMNIKIKEIVFIETYSHNTIIHTFNMSYDIRKDTRLVLKDKMKYFIRVHRSYYINCIYLHSIVNGNILLKNNVTIPIGKTYIKSLKELIFQSLK